VRIVLADREGMARTALASLLREIDGVERVVEVGDRAALGNALRRGGADVLVIDDRLVDDGRHLLAGLGPLHDTPRVIVVGVDDDPAYAARAMRLGAEAWVAKDRSDEDLPGLLDGR
jgi:DNA-binding NarL/FixJ family response regulator